MLEGERGAVRIENICANAKRNEGSLPKEREGSTWSEKCSETRMFASCYCR